MQYSIHTTTSPIVREHSREIQPDELQKKTIQIFCDDLVQAMIEYDGIGIAACQVGKPLRIIVIDKEYTKTPDHLVLINPRLVSASKRTSMMEEGCLSVPGTFGIVERSIKVRVKALLRDGTPSDWKAKGMLARIFQHELDHLDGTLFIDKAFAMETKTLSALNEKHAKYRDA